MPIKALTIQGSYVGSVIDLRELVALAQSGALPSLPVTMMPQSQAYDALLRLRDGRVNGRVVLRADAV
jgi:alcohol dehydrogenase/propanol-preferring alcohol dehydrogenase